MGESCAALIRGLPLPGHVARAGLTAAMLAPARLQRASHRAFRPASPAS
jgi:D-arginine dehydrogenase